MSEGQREQFSDIERAMPYDDYAFLPEHARFTLCEHFRVKSLDGFGCEEMTAAVAAAGAIVHYLKHQLRRKIDHLATLRCDASSDYVLLDAATQANLELVEIARRSRTRACWLCSIARSTPMGGRKLRAGFCGRCAI